MLTALDIETLGQAVEAVFVTMMNLNVSPVKTNWALSQEQLTSAVHMWGIWNGTLFFECNRRLACQFTGLLLSMEPPETVNDDVRDAMGELANMIGGNLKSSLAFGLRLSLPSVTEGNDYGTQVGGPEVTGRLAFACSNGPFWVTLLAGVLCRSPQ